MPKAAANKGVSRSASAASTASTLIAASASTRVHRSIESHQGFVGSQPPSSHSGWSTYSPTAAAGSPQDKVVLALIKRLTSKLPCYSGLTLTEVESDDAVQMTIKSLAELARHAIDIIVWKLSEELEKLARQTDQNGHRVLDVLQSQLFLLKVMSVTMAYRWQCYRAETPTQNAHTSEPLAGPHNNGNSNGTPASPSPSAASTAAAKPSHLKRGTRPPSTEHLSGSSGSGSGSPWFDAPPLDENCARWLVSVMLLLLRQAAPTRPNDERGKWYGAVPALGIGSGNGNFNFDATLYGFESVDRDTGWTASVAADHPDHRTNAPGPSTPSPLSHQEPRKSPSLTSVTSSPTAVGHIPHAVLPLPIPRAALIFQPTARTLTKSSLSLHGLIARWAGTIVYLLSAANWGVVFARIRGRIHQFAQAPAPGASQAVQTLAQTQLGLEESSLDVGDLGLVQHCAIDRSRLVQILQELSSLLVNMKRDGLAAVALALRKAIWTWIEVFPHEYDEVVSGARRLDGAPERLFDLLFQSGEAAAVGGRSWAALALWPVLTMLMNISYDRQKLFALKFDWEATGPKRTNNKEIQFIEQILKNLTPTSKFDDVSMLCCIDICRAAVRTRPDDPEVIIRTFAAEVADEIKSRLWKPSTQRAFYESPDQIDVTLYADAIVAMFRFLPEEESMQIFGACLEPERSDAVKMCAVKACVVLALSASRLPWQPSLKPLYAKVTRRIRSIFKSALLRRNEMDEQKNIRRTASRPNAKRFTSETIADRELLVLAILSLYRAEPHFFLTGCTADDWDHWVSDALQLLQNPSDPAVSLGGVRTFMQTARWAVGLSPGEDLYEEATMWLRISAPDVLLTASHRLLDARDNFEEQRLYMEMARGVLSLFSRPIDNEPAESWRLSPARIPAIAVAEIAFLVSLTSADNVVSILAAKGLRDVAMAERLPNAPINENLPEEERVKRYPIYEQVGDPKVTTIGRVGHQKRLRKLLRVLATPCATHVAVWQECYWRWSALEESVSRRSLDGSAEGSVNGHKPAGDSSLSADERLYQWQNLTLFLAAFGAACCRDQGDDQALTSIVPPKFLPDRFRLFRDVEETLHNFITSAVDFLVTESVPAREIVKEALGNELSPRLYAKLFKRLNDTIEEIVNAAAKETEYNTASYGEDEYFVFFEQSLIVLKLMIDRVDFPTEDLLESVDLSQTLLSLAKIIDRFNATSSLRIKVKLCIFCESALGRLDALGLRKDDAIRNNLLDAVVEWIQPEGVDWDVYEDGLIRSQYDANVVMLKTIVKLLDHLRLQPLENSGDDAAHVVSRRFSRYQNVLVRALAFGRSEDMAEEDRASVHSSYSHRKATTERDAEMRELVITGLAYLLSANTDVGLKHCLPLGYDKDPKKRAMFCHATARVLGLGTKLEASNNSTLVVRRNRLCDLVKGSDMILVLAICETCPASEVDIMIPVILNLFNSRASLMTLLKLVIEREVKSTSHQSLLFRSNTMRTRLISAFAKLHGYDYLRTVLKPLFDQMCGLPQDCSFELDPAKAQGQNLEKNQETVRLLAQAFLDVICASAPALPPMFREICTHISITVAEVWPEAKFAALGGFIFLRFISPTLVSPDSIDIELPRENVDVLRRGLLVVTKIIQNLANNMLFVKENHMTYFNDFLQANIVRITRFLSVFNKQPTPGIEEEPDEWVGATFDDTDAIVLHRFFEKHADKVGKELLSLSKPSKEGEAAAIAGKRAWDTLCAALVDMGQPMEVPQISPLPMIEFDEYMDFMTRNSERDSSTVQDLFFRITTDNPGNQNNIFIMPIWKFDVEVLDFELFFCHVFKLLTAPEYSNRPFEIILDCTGFTSASEVPVQWFKFCVELIPLNIRERFMASHILNPNALMQRYLRKLYNICAGISLTSDIRAYSSVRELYQRVIGSVAQPSLEYASSLEKEPMEVFKEVTLRQAHWKLGVTLAVAQTHLRIASIKTQNIFSNLSSKPTEIVPLSDVGDIYNISMGRDANEFIIRRSRNGGALYFSSPDRDHIVKAIRVAKGRVRNGMAVTLDRFPRLSNVSATLLNIGMINISHEEEVLRGAAFDLLSAVCSSLNFDDSPLLLSKAGFIPGHPSGFAVLLGERLASFTPKLTLDFISEVCVGLDKCSIAQRINSLQYMYPWIRNLSLFCNPTNKLYEQSGAKLRDCIRLLIDITIRDNEVQAMIQKYIWLEVGKLDSAIVTIVLDELMRAAVDGGIGSRRCEVMADTMASLSSINVRGRIFAKIRKTLGKASLKPTKHLPDNAHWTEIATYTRLALVTGYHSRQIIHNQLFVPEITQVITLLAATGETIVRVSVYGLAMNLLQCLYTARADDPTGSEIRLLLDEFAQPEVLHLFGLVRLSPSSEYSSLEAKNEQQAIEALEHLARLLLKAVTIGAGNTGLANIWRARWMSLLTTTAFQLLPSIQPRAFIVMGTLTSSEVDDDLLYQMLVALKTAMKTSDESDTLCVVSMLRCICNLVPALPETSRYLPQMFWLGVALLQSSHVAFYKEATRLLCASLETLRSQNALNDKGFTLTLLEARAPLEEISLQLDQLLGISFDSNFSFSLASVIFKGIRRPQLRDSATTALRCLLTIALATSFAIPSSPDHSHGPIHPEILGYFLALLSVSTTPELYRQLLRDAGINSNWVSRDEFVKRMDDDDEVPHVPFALLGCEDADMALLVTSFVGAMLSTAQGDDAESQILYNLLSDAASIFPDVVSLTYEGLQEKINDTFANSTNPNILSAVSAVFRIAMEDPTRGLSAHSSASSLGTVEESSTYGPGPKHILALEKLNMQGIASTFQFLQPNRGHATKILNWFPELITRIIE